MFLFGAILYAALGLYSLIVVIRIIVEMVQSFSKQFDPPSWFMVVAEGMFVVTDPPVKFFRKLIPPMRMSGGIGIDVSVIVLFVAIMLPQLLVRVPML